MRLVLPRARCTCSAADGTVLHHDEHSHPSIEALQLAAPRIRALLLAPGQGATADGSAAGR